MKYILVNAVTLLIICCLPLCSFAADSQEKHARESCLAEMILTAPDDMTAGEMRSRCQEQAAGTDAAVGDGDAGEINAVERRLSVDELNILRPFTIMAHRQNYFLLAGHNFQGYSEAGYPNAGDEDFSFKNTETHFQLSIKTPLAADLFDRNVNVFAAYTLRSFWQLYNGDASSPFRETNHEPELWLQAHPDFEIFGFSNTADVFGIVHQSNGQSGRLSRSWNRIYADFIFHRGDFAVSIKPWIRLEEDEDDDDNPDITDYLGHGELRLAYRLNDQTFTLMSRNNLESGFSKGSLQLGWSFPLFDYPFIRGYIQYFSGYGESLIDYDNYVNRIGVGILLTDLL